MKISEVKIHQHDKSKLKWHTVLVKLPPVSTNQTLDDNKFPKNVLRSIRSDIRNVLYYVKKRCPIIGLWYIIYIYMTVVDQTEGEELSCWTNSLKVGDWINSDGPTRNWQLHQSSNPTHLSRLPLYTPSLPPPRPPSCNSTVPHPFLAVRIPALRYIWHSGDISQLINLRGDSVGTRTTENHISHRNRISCRL